MLGIEEDTLNSDVASGFGLDLPLGREWKTSFTGISRLQNELKKEVFTGYLEAEIPNFGPIAGGFGKVLFFQGDIVAATFKTCLNTHFKGDAIMHMFLYPIARNELYSYDDTEIWLAIERNRHQLFEHAPFEDVEHRSIEKSEKALTRENLMERYRLKDMADVDVERLIKLAME